MGSKSDWPTMEVASLTLDELTGWARERMANYKVPRHLHVLDDLPRTRLLRLMCLDPTSVSGT